MMAVMVTSSVRWLRVMLEPALGQDFEAEVAALLGPFVVLFGQDGADQPDQ